MNIETSNEEETKALASEILNSIKKSSDHATTIFLNGDLGAGKTTFAKGLAGALGVTEEITSPTFVIQKIYKLKADAPFKKLIHMDCYRLKTKEELFVLDIEEVLNNPDNLVLIEWPDKVREILAKPSEEIDFTFIDENTRKIAYAEKN